MVPSINAGDTAWLLVCCSLVLLMTPALASSTGAGPQEERPVHADVELCLHGPDRGPVVLYGLFPVFRNGHRRPHRRPELRGFQGGGRPAHPDYAKTVPQALCRLPDDVRGHYAGPDHGRLRGADPIQEFHLLQPPLATLVYDPLCTLGLGKGWMAPGDGRCWISREEPWSTSPRGSRPGLRDGDRPAQGYGQSPWSPTIFP